MNFAPPNLERVALAAPAMSESPELQRDALIEGRCLSKQYTNDRGQKHVVCSNISVALRKREIVALLGHSGAGKSTLLRMLAGLITPTDGQVFTHGQPLTGPAPDAAMVFQSFALLPWLTVIDNVQIGLERANLTRSERKARAQSVIDAVGLHGCEQSFPKQLSGGMCQRVGLARALAVRPQALLMDEPFSALDVQTAQQLRTLVIELWQQQREGLSSVLIVTHNIEEAVQMADRILVLGSTPGRIVSEVAVHLLRTGANRAHTEEGQRLVRRLYASLTGALSTDEACSIRLTESNDEPQKPDSEQEN
ncbi:ABC transporter ATP-binding protein [Bifidobacterium dolichotidis]|uniref:ABC transporter ATP-binding protein n=1 Tax=Bifidobacterium dolichotidis TaxID=2306976 RepID=A0A430FQK5_9BIFI|nr:ABC transporter ATP-binding protein [Bifidobacterium dolichotidis]RSX55098.1 ABC transporter ATP-binding protein [Bifidobacterium dolichotidis]